MKNREARSTVSPVAASLSVRALLGSLVFLSLSLPSFAQVVTDRTAAFEMNQRLGNGIVFGSNMWENNIWQGDDEFYYDVRDFELAREHDFNHARITARVQNMVPRNTTTNHVSANDPAPLIDETTMNRIFATVDWALDNDLIAVICPFFWWKGQGNPSATYNGDPNAYPEPQAFDTPEDVEALAHMWGQIAAAFQARGQAFRDGTDPENIRYEYTPDQVVFELYEEPEANIDVKSLIQQCVDNIRDTGSDHYIIIPGRGFKTIVGMGRVFEDDLRNGSDGGSGIPLDDSRLIGTFHFYEPKCEFTNIYQGACEGDPEENLLGFWPEDESGLTYPADEDLPPPDQATTEYGPPYGYNALRSWFVNLNNQNNAWADRFNTVPIPVYMGEYGTLNKPSLRNNRTDLERDQRKNWIWWTRMVAEEFGYSTAYWRSYNPATMGLGNFDLDPQFRNFVDPDDPTDEAFIRHALLGRYEAEDDLSVAQTNGFLRGEDGFGQPDVTSDEYLSFLNTNPNQVLNFNDVYVGRDGSYNVTIRFSNAHSSELYLNIESQKDGSAASTSLTSVPFIVTGASNWYAKTVKMDLKAGINNIRLSGTSGDLRIDFIGITQQSKLFLDQFYDFAGRDDRLEADGVIIFQDRFEGDLSAWTDPVSTDSSAQSLLDQGGLDQQGLRLLDDETTATRVDSVSFSEDVDPSSNLYIQYDYLHQPGVLNPAFQLRGGGLAGINLNMRSTNGFVGYRSGGGLIETDTSLKSGQWYRFTLTVPPVDTASDQFDLHIYKLSGGDPFEVRYPGLPFENDLDSREALRFRYLTVAQAISGEFAIDNVLVTNSPDLLNFGAVSSLPIQNGLVLHLDASRMAGLSDAQPLTTLPNLAAFGSEASTEDPSSAPTFQVDVLNGRPAFRFDGVDDWVDIGNLRNSIGAMEVFVVTQSLGTEGGNWQNIISSYSSNDHLEAPNWRMLRPNQGGSPASVSASIQTLSAESDLQLSGINLGRRAFEGSNYYTGDIAETIIFDRVLEVWERKIVEYYLARKYGMDIENYVDPFEDFDQDGVSDYDELIAGTLINDSDNYFSAEFDVSDGNFQLRLDTVFERNYTFFRTYDFIEWTELDSFIGDDLEQLFEESIDTQNAAFYRIDITHPWGEL